MKYSPQDDLVIAQEIAKNPGNIKAGIESARKILKRTFGAVNGRYYGSVINNKSIMLLASNTGEVMMNRKNLPAKSLNHAEEPLMLEIIRETVPLLSRAQKKDLVKLIMSI